MTITIRVRRYEQFGRLARRLRAAAAGGLEREAAKELQRAAVPVLASVRTAVLSASFPSASPDTTDIVDPPRSSLRAGLAAATRTTALHNGVRFGINGAAVGRGPWGARLAALSDTETAPGWHHPVFGGSESVGQLGRPWFFVTIRAGEPEFRAGVQRAMDVVARRIEG